MGGNVSLRIRNKLLFNLKQKQTYSYLLVAFICLLLTLWYTLVSESTLQTSLYAYQRNFVETGQWWRIITAHFMHSNVIHFGVNIVGLFLLWLLHGDYVKPTSFFINIFILCVGISSCIYLWSVSTYWYVGLSGVLHGLFAWGVIVDISLKRKTGYLLLIGLVIKIVDEQFFSSSQYMSNLIDVSVAIDAHFYGALIGLILGLVKILGFSSKITRAEMSNRR